jgi:hypothetical protein
MSQPVILALDLGTSLFRGLLFNEGKPAADRMVRRAYQFALLPEAADESGPPAGACCSSALTRCLSEQSG